MSDFLWVEKYRPKKIQDCILSEDLKQTFLEFVKKKEIPNLLLSGTPGTGKTTVARALCEEIGVDYIIINGSDEGRQIDTLRNKIKNFASTISLTKEANHKVVIIDEADYMNAESVQPALRNFIETFFNNCRFIFTCNFKSRIIEALHSRCTVIDFKIINGQKVKTAAKLMDRLSIILKDEGIEFDKNVLAEVIQKHYPDFRRTINELQRYSVRGKIDSGILFSLKEENYKDLIVKLKDKDFNGMRKWVSQNLDHGPTHLFKEIYELLYLHLEPKSIPQAVLIIAGYQYKAAFVADQEINMVACLTEIMAGCKFK
jgi:DNA polymerase III delta prime subunit